MVDVDRSEGDRFGQILIGFEDVESGVPVESVEIDGFEHGFAPGCETGKLDEYAFRTRGVALGEKAEVLPGNSPG